VILERVHRYIFQRNLWICKKKRILIDELDNEYIEIDGKKLSVQETPYNHKNVNILGLKALSHFELNLFKDMSFGFKNLPDYL